MMLDREPVGGFIRKTVAVGALLGMTVACSPTSESSPTGAPVNPDLSSLPECQNNNSVVMHGDYSSSFITPYDYYLNAEDIVFDLDYEIPDALPAEYFNAALDEASTKLGEQINVVLDDSLNLGDDWGTYEEGKKIALIDHLAAIIDELSRYPDNLFSSFGVNTLRLADLYKNFGGHYNTAANELSFEVNQSAFPDKVWNYFFLTHELAHAYHDKYCGGNVDNDPELSGFNSISYIGNASDKDSKEEIGALRSLVPPELYIYGRSREFVEPYSVSSTQEDFATLLAWTMSSRGLIREGDADYESPIYYKQQLVVQRLEAMIPGTATFLGKITSSLRMDVDNDIHAGNLIETTVSAQEILEEVEANPPESLVLNGVRADMTYGEKPYIGVLPYPSLMVSEWMGLEVAEETTWNLFESIDPARPNIAPITLFVPADSIVDREYVGDLVVNATSTPKLPAGVVFGRTFNTGDPGKTQLLDELVASNNLVPIKLTITPE